MPDGENSGVAGGNGATEMTSRESFLSTGVGVSLALLLLRGATARVDEPVADLMSCQYSFKSLDLVSMLTWFKVKLVSRQRSIFWSSVG